MTYSATGYIIGKEDVREHDRIFTLYTKEFGKKIVLAQGVRKITSKLCGNLELLSSVSLVLARGRSLDRITGVEMLDRFLPVKEQLGKCSAACYFLEVFNHLVKDGQQDSGLFELMCDFFNSLASVHTSKASFVGSAALVKLGSVLGYQGRSKGIVQSLQRSQSLLTFVRGRTKQECQAIARSAQTFVHDQCEKQLLSAAYFEYYAGKESSE